MANPVEAIQPRPEGPLPIEGREILLAEFLEEFEGELAKLPAFQEAAAPHFFTGGYIAGFKHGIDSILITVPDRDPSNRQLFVQRNFIEEGTPMEEALELKPQSTTDAIRFRRGPTSGRTTEQYLPDNSYEALDEGRTLLARLQAPPEGVQAQLI